MKTKFIELFRIALSLFPERVLNVLIEQIFIVMKTRPLHFAYQRIGINQRNSDIGEMLFLSKEFPSLLKLDKKSRITVFDVGANNGKYAYWVKQTYHESIIHCFEPLPEACRNLTNRFKNNSDVLVVNCGLSEFRGRMSLHTYVGDPESEHATLHADVLLVAHGSEENTVIDISVNTLDDYCQENKVFRIDLLKIDTEGHELAVLRGAQNMLRNNRIGAVQFEFNEMNIFSKVFMRDFYDLLVGFQFYRITNTGLIDLGKYLTEYEIFKFQNIVAVNSVYKN